MINIEREKHAVLLTHYDLFNMTLFYNTLVIIGTTNNTFMLGSTS